ncbi:MAG TPA: class IV lanthionine synthetase LanL [Streptosporangiaceae bacterium]
MDDPGTSGDRVERLVRDALGAGYRIVTGPVWLMVVPEEPGRPEGPELPEHGWKLHISARAAALPDLVEVIAPVLVAAGCAFKLARSERVLARLNDGISSPASVGKAVTIYPHQDRVKGLGLELAGLLRGWHGPRILSDRRVVPSAPVYYRYGPFAAAWESDPHGRLRTAVHGPGGEVFEGAATLAYRQPSWVSDPFTGDAGGDRPAGPDILGGRYQLTSGLRQAAQGNVYRAIDRRDGRAVVIKQARALVSEDHENVDTRLRLRNERRVLQALDGVAGVPRLLDHFRHGDDEFLVTTDCGDATLAEDMLAHGLYGPAAGPRSLDTLAAALARIVADLHGRGVIMRDISPKNIVLGRAGPSVLDFGIARYDGLHLPGATPGFAPARQWRGELPSEADDYYALGMTLLFAITGLDPVNLGEDRDQPRVRAWQTIGSAYGQRPTGIIGLIAGLINDDEQTARAAFLKLLSGAPDGTPRLKAALPVIGALGPQQAADIAGTMLADLLDGAAGLLNSSAGQSAAHDASIYSGSSGVGLELLHHLSDPRTGPLIADLATFSVAAAQRVKLPPGLFLGTTGVRIFLRQARDAGIPAPAGLWEPPGPDWLPDGEDLISGAAGVGLGQLWLHQATGDPADLAVAVRCGQAVMGQATPQSALRATVQAVPGIDASAGRAHGLAGVTEFLLALADHTGDQPTLAAARHQAGALAEHTRRLLPQARSGVAAPIAVSWCQGLAGIGQVLLRASVVLADPSLAELARQTADACIGFVPRLSVVTRCCGAAGVGHFLIDLAVTSQHERYWQAACDVARQMLLRSGGSPAHPVFVRGTTDPADVTWSFGIAGLLPFFRRLARQAGPDRLPVPSPHGSLQWGGRKVRC